MPFALGAAAGAGAEPCEPRRRGLMTLHPEVPVAAKVRIAAVADLHVAKDPNLPFQSLLAQVADAADVLVVCGDLTHYGLVDEAEIVAKELARLRIPVLAVLGNHDHHSDQQERIHSVLVDAGIRVLDGDVAEVLGIGFAGTKG